METGLYPDSVELSKALRRAGPADTGAVTPAPGKGHRRKDVLFQIRLVGVL